MRSPPQPSPQAGPPTETRMFHGRLWVGRLGRTVPVGVLLALVLLVAAQVWSVYPPEDGLRLQNGRLVGGDFIALYTGGVLMRGAPDQLYDLEHQRQARAEVLEQAPDMAVVELPFVYPPLVAAAMVPFSYLSLASAFYLWVAIGVAASIAALLALGIAVGAYAPTRVGVGVLAVFAFVPFSIDTLVGGQLSWLGIVVFASVTTATLKGRPGLAGLLMALGYYKPPLFVFAAIYLAIRLGGRFLGGCAVGAGLATALTLWVQGFEGTLAYVSMAAGYRYGQELMEGVTLPPEAGVGLFSFFTSVMGAGGANLWTLVGVSLLLLMPAVWLRTRQASVAPIELAYVITASVAVSLQAITYDLAILLVGFLLILTEFRRIQPGIRVGAAVAIGAFYLEFPFRRLEVGEILVNAAWFAFVLLLGVLWVAMARDHVEVKERSR